MKKLLALLLALTLTAALTVPALAAEEAGEEVPIAACDEEEAPDTEASPYDRGWSDGYDETYPQGRDDGLAAGRAGIPADPEETVPFPKESRYPAASYEYGKEEGRYHGYASGYHDGYLEVTGRDYTEDLIVAGKGGVPGQVNVMFNGKMLSFPDQKPELRKGRTMVPVRAVMEGMGAEVEYDPANRSVTIVLNDSVVTFTVGSDVYTVFTGGETATEKMDCACCLKGGRTMVPIRFLAEAGSCTVLWDAGRRTVIVVDDRRLKAAIDQKFLVIDEIMNARLGARLGKKLETTVTFQSRSVLYDEDSKAITVPFSGKAVTWTDGAACRAELSIDAREGLKALAGSDLELLDTSSLSLGTALRTDPSDLRATLLVDSEGNGYLSAPALVELETGLRMKDNEWLSLGRVLPAGAEPEAMTGGPMTVGILLVDSLLEDPETAFFLQEALDATVPMLEAIWGDSAAVRNGDSYTWTMDLADLTRALLPEGVQAEGIQEEPIELEGLDFTSTFTADAKGNYSLSGSLSVTDEDAGAMTGSIRASGTETGGRLRLRLSLEDALDLEFSAARTVKAVTALPDLSLPEGAVVVEPPETDEC